MKVISTKDSIESIIIESVRLGEKARKKREIGNFKDAKEYEEKSEELWQQAKELGKPYVHRKNYENLANAILQSAIEDYEQLISGTLDEGSEGVSKYEIEGLMREQTFVQLNMEELLSNIKSIYENRFIPYANAHKDEILSEWKKFDKQGLTIEDRIKATKHHCPMCGGAMRPGFAKVCCTTCYLSVNIPFYNA